MTLGDIVRKYREEHGVTTRMFAALSGLSSGYISMLEANRNPGTGNKIIPSLRTINHCARAMGISLTELLISLDEDQKIHLGLNDDSFATAAQLSEKYSSPPLPANILPLPKTRKVPLLGAIACGEPILAEENVEAYIDVAEDIHCDFTLRCKGDSMVDARIFDGDIVYIRQQPDVENGEIAAVLIDGAETEATLKRVYKSDGQITLAPANPSYAPLVYVGEDMAKVRIIGKAVAFTSAIR